MRTYLGISIVRAEPARGPDGKPGYNVHAPTGVRWIPQAVFEHVYRSVDRREAQLLTANASELELAAISDGVVHDDLIG